MNFVGGRNSSGHLRGRSNATRPSGYTQDRLTAHPTLWIGLLTLLILCGCSTARTHAPANSRSFQFERDTFAYANELVWEYYYDQDGKWRHRRNPAEPDYTHRCFVVVRSARQFFQFARFDPNLPAADEDGYRELIKEVLSCDPAGTTEAAGRVVIPGYSDLRSFSTDHEQLLKDMCGGRWRSYFQRGHWRMIFPFSRKGQAREAEALAAAVSSNRPPVVHVLRFPSLAINHSLLLYQCRDDDSALVFTAYDPNHPQGPVELSFDKATRTFHYPANNYWKGGTLDVYEIYRAWNY